jgi:putative ABC transport system substrate-binding protein
VLTILFFAFGFPVQAQQTKKAPQIGFLAGSREGPSVEAFRQGLRDLGYIEGKNIVIEYRYSEGKLDRLRELAAELVRLDVDAIVTSGPTPNRAAKEATVTIPIVMGYDTDPVGNGFVASLARAGGNITGLSTLAPEISGKQVELLKEIVPRLSHWPSSGLRPAMCGTTQRWRLNDENPLFSYFLPSVGLRAYA